MDKRNDLQSLLETLLGSRNVYFQPPASVLINYPAIIYSRSDIDVKKANNKTYLSKVCYKITVIDSDPESPVITKLLRQPLCKFIQHYVSDNLNHDVFSIFY